MLKFTKAFLVLVLFTVSLNAQTSAKDKFFADYESLIEQVRSGRPLLRYPG